jgi:hypothetical protein
VAVDVVAFSKLKTRHIGEGEGEGIAFIVNEGNADDESEEY